MLGPESHREHGFQPRGRGHPDFSAQPGGRTRRTAHAEVTAYQANDSKTWTVRSVPKGSGKCTTCHKTPLTEPHHERVTQSVTYGARGYAQTAWATLAQRPGSGRNRTDQYPPVRYFCQRCSCHRRHRRPENSLVTSRKSAGKFCVS